MDFGIPIMLVGILAGCGRLGFEPADAPELEQDAASLGAWSTPIEVTELSAGADDPSLTTDQLEIYFNSSRAGGMGSFDVWMASRTSTDEPFGPPVNVASVNSAGEDTTPEISGDGLTLHLSSVRAGGCGSADVYVAMRASRTSAWTAPALLAELCSAESDKGAMMTRDALAIFFTSRRAGGRALYTATRVNATSPWSTPVRVSELDGPGEEESPFLDPARLTIWFATDDLGTMNLYVATRQDPLGVFSAPVLIPELNSTTGATDPWVSDDARVIYFKSNRQGRDRIFRATR